MTAGRRRRDGPTFQPRDRGRLGARRARRSFAIWAARLAFVAIVFWLGIALGRALEDTPRPGGTQTLLRTLTPETLPATRTVTVTTAE